MSFKHMLRQTFPCLFHLYCFCLARWKYRGLLKFDYSCRIDLRSSFEGANKLCQNVRFSGSLGYGSYIGGNSNVEAYIGRFTSIAPNLSINKGVHPISAPYATTSPLFYSVHNHVGKTFAKRKMFEETRPYTIIGNDVWIGQNVFMTGGITIGDGAVVLSGSIVTHSVPAYSVVGGVPARVIKMRYTDDVIATMNKISWWNQPISWLEDHWELFCDIDSLICYYNNHSDEFVASQKEN